jgi:hypothetical protein
MKLFGMTFGASKVVKPVPDSLTMQVGTRVIVIIDGKKHYGTFRGASPSGRYMVLMDDEWGLLSVEEVSLK